MEIALQTGRIAVLERIQEDSRQTSEPKSASLNKALELERREARRAENKIVYLEAALERSDDQLAATASDLRDVSFLLDSVLVIVVLTAIVFVFAVLHGLGLLAPCLQLNGSITGLVMLPWILGQTLETASMTLQKDEDLWTWTDAAVVLTIGLGPLTAGLAAVARMLDLLIQNPVV